LITLVLAGSIHAASKVQLQVGKDKILLPHVEATRFEKSDGSKMIILLFTAKKPEGVTVIDEFGNQGFTLQEWVQKSKTSAVTISFTEGAEENYSLNTYNVAGKDMALGGTNSGGEVRGVFKKLDLKADRIGATLQYSGEPGPLSGTFDTPLTTLKEAQWVKGPQVGKSPQAKVLLAYAKAMLKGDLAAATRLSVNDEKAEMERNVKMMGSADRVKKIIKMEFVSPKEFEKLLNSADASMAESANGTKIKVVKRFKDSSTETSTFGLYKVDGAWKVNW